MIDYLQKICDKLEYTNKAAIFPHVRPDGDAIGSACALHLALEEKGIPSIIFISELIPDKYSFFTDKCKFSLEVSTDFDTLISVDCAEISRLDKYATVYTQSINTINIDHHISNKRYAAINYVEEASSTTQLILKLIDKLNIKLNKEIATCLYVGLVTDTGSFLYTNTNSKAFEDAKRLISYNIDVDSVANKIVKSTSLNRVKLLSKSLNNIRLFYDNRIAILPILQENLLATDTSINDTEGFVNEALQIDSVQIAASVCYYSQELYKISLRCKGNFDVNDIASRFGGGGHKRAAGCNILGEYEEVVDKLVYAISTCL